MPTISVGEREIFYARHKARTGARSLILIHGAAGSHLDWPADLRRLEDATVYALDLPGHGRSPGPARDTISGYTGDILAFIETLKIQRAILVGLSMGSAIALSAALTDGSPAAGLVLMGSAPRLKVAPIILDSLASGAEEVAYDFIIAHSWSDNIPAAMIEDARRQLNGVSTESVLADFRACSHFDVKDQLERIGIPTLVIVAEKDRMTPEKNGRELAAAIPDSELAVIAGAGHMVILEQPEQVTRLVRRFVSRQPDN